MNDELQKWIPTDEVAGFQVCPGLYGNYGATVLQTAVNFTVHSKGAAFCELLLFHRTEEERMQFSGFRSILRSVTCTP